MIRKIFSQAAAEFGISNHLAVEAHPPFKPDAPAFVKASRKSLSDDLINAVDQALPAQPWKPRVHVEVAKQLNCSVSSVSSAIQTLIEDGRRYPQKDGVIYGTDGSVLMIDPDRASDQDSDPQ